METLHLRAEHNVIEHIMTVVNQYSREGQEIEVIDNKIATQYLLKIKDKIELISKFNHEFRENPGFYRIWI
jgi:signal transduction histidine kinase